MRNRADEIRRRHRERKKKRWHASDPGRRMFYSTETGEREDHFDIFHQHNGPKDTPHPLFGKERFLIKCMLAVCLFLLIGVLFKHPNEELEGARQFVRTVFERDFQFATVASWYEEQFGKPLALFPEQNNEPQKQTANYAVPANATVVQTFADNGKGIILETVGGLAVEAVKQGMVVAVKNTESLGKTVVIQHPDGNESWYGQLSRVDIDLYDYVRQGAKIGEATPIEGGRNGTFYFALKKSGKFINPLRVIDFE